MGAPADLADDLAVPRADGLSTRCRVGLRGYRPRRRSRTDPEPAGPASIESMTLYRIRSCPRPARCQR